LKKNNKVGGLTLPDFKTYCQATVMKTVWYWHEDIYRDKCSRIENQEVNLHIYGQMVFNKGAKTIQ